MANINTNNELNLEDIIDDLIGYMAVKDLKKAHHSILCALIQGNAIAKYQPKQKKQIVEYFTLLSEMFERLAPYEKVRFDRLND